MTQQFEDKLKERTTGYSQNTEYLSGFNNGAIWAKEQLTQKGKRYFVLFYRSVESVGHYTQITQGEYINFKKALEHTYKKYGEECVITNIIELSEQDYQDFIKE